MTIVGLGALVWGTGLVSATKRIARAGAVANPEGMVRVKAQSMVIVAAWSCFCVLYFVVMRLTEAALQRIIAPANPKLVSDLSAGMSNLAPQHQHFVFEN